MDTTSHVTEHPVTPSSCAQERALALMDPILRPGSSLAPECPLVFGPEAPGWVVVTEVEGEGTSIKGLSEGGSAAGSDLSGAALLLAVICIPDLYGHPVGADLYLEDGFV